MQEINFPQAKERGLQKNTSLLERWHSWSWLYEPSNYLNL